MSTTYAGTMERPKRGLHETCNLLTWRDHHGPQFCAALVHLWEREFGIPESRSRPGDDAPQPSGKVAAQQVLASALQIA